MDFKRIEVIFLCAFTALNVFLLSTYWQSSAEEASNGSQRVDETIEKRLSKDNIRHGKLSDKVEEGYYISGEKTNLFSPELSNLEGQSAQTREGRFVSYLNNELFMPFNEVKPNEAIDKFIVEKEHVHLGTDYVYSKELSNKDTGVVYLQKWNKFVFIDETAELKFPVDATKDNKIVSYEQSHVGEIESLREKQDLVTEKAAVEILYRNTRIPSNSQIKWIRLAYTRLLEVREKTVYIPAWFVAVEASEKSLQIEKVNAINGSIITSNVSEYTDDSSDVEIEE